MFSKKGLMAKKQRDKIEFEREDKSKKNKIGRKKTA